MLKLQTGGEYEIPGTPTCPGGFSLAIAVGSEHEDYYCESCSEPIESPVGLCSSCLAEEAHAIKEELATKGSK